MSAEDREKFKNIFWNRLCQRYRYLHRNTTDTEFIFDRQITRPIIDRGLDIHGFEDPFIEHMLNEIGTEGLIDLIPNTRQFRLNHRGIEHCEELPVTYG